MNIKETLYRMEICRSEFIGSNIHITNIYRCLDHVYLRLATFREILSLSGIVNGVVFTYI